MIISGTGFGQGATVTFGGSQATSVVVVDAFTITCLTPTHAVGLVTVVVTNPDGQSAQLNNAFSYSETWETPPSQEVELSTQPGDDYDLEDPLAPSPTSVVLSSGTKNGGLAILIVGEHFVSGATVTIGGNNLLSTRVVNSKAIFGITPAHAIGAVDIVVTNPDAQTGTLSSGYTYINLATTVISVSPASGTTAGGTTLTIQGTNFVDPVIVTIGGLTATSPTVVNAQTVTCVSPAHTKGEAEISVRNTT